MTDLDHLVNKYSSEKPLGECVLVIRGKPADEVEKEAQARWESLSLQEHVSFYENEGLSHKDAMRQAASDRGLSRRDVYQALLAQKE